MQTRTALHIARPTYITLTSLMLAASFALGACEGSSDGENPTPNGTAAPNETEIAPATLEEPLTASAAPDRAEPEAAAARVCRELMVRERDCSAAFIPALVAERVRVDIPAGIAADDQQRGREALVSQALDEYAVDSQDGRIASTCAEVARNLPPERSERLVTAGTACLALSGCEPFVACAVPIGIQP